MTRLCNIPYCINSILQVIVTGDDTVNLVGHQERYHKNIDAETIMEVIKVL